jgi:hypothetical protein
MWKLSASIMNVQCTAIYSDSVLVGAMVKKIQGVFTFEYLEDHGKIRTKVENSSE